MEPAAVVETHISVLFFYGDRVYKVRKPVTTPFLDFSTRELRLADCRREVELNRRLAPDVYLGVHDVVDSEGRPVDHLVVMRRLPAQRRLSTLLEQPGFDDGHLLAVARRIAAFHERAARSAAIDAAGSTDHLTMLWRTNLAETEPYLGDVLDAPTHARLGARAHAYLAGRAPLFEQRVAAGRIVDGHGDLLAQDIYCLDDGPRILDCIEFDHTFRWGDVLYDTAFLAMDLEHRGRPDLAARFLADYREHSAETHPRSLADWYIAYRALIRCKIACLVGDAEQARAFLAQADRRMADAEVHLVLVGGLPGTGKSTLAEALADRLGWEVLRSDEVRKDLAGIGHTHSAQAPAFEGIYAPRVTEATYRELLHRADVALGMGESVVMDATWLYPQHREAARALALARHAVLREVRCALPVEVAVARVQARAAAGGDVSDATPQVVAALAERAAGQWAEADCVDTGVSVESVLQQTLAHVRPDLATATTQGGSPG